MSDGQPLDAALVRVEQALRRLETVIDGRLDADRSVDGLEDEVRRLGEDRSRLAQDMDAAEARSARLEEVNREVSRRLVGAMESIRSVLEARGG